MKSLTNNEGVFMVTIKDIAKIAGVSHTTVSRALNDNPLINKDTRKKIKQIALELNYVPNPSARSLVTKKSYVIGLFFSSLDDSTSSSFLVDVFRGVQSVLDNRYKIVINSINNLDQLELLNGSYYDGLVIVSQSEDDNEFIYQVKNSNLPLVVLNRQIEDQGIPNVIANDRLGVKQAIDYGISVGHTEIGLIEGKKGFKSTLERKEGYFDSLCAFGYAIDYSYIRQGDYTMETGYQCMLSLIDNIKHPTLVFCSNDDMAVGAMKACHERNLHVPKDISVIGFDDSMFSQYTIPSLTTVKKPMYEISKKGTEILKSLMNHELIPKEKMKIMVETELIVRESVKKIS